MATVSNREQGGEGRGSQTPYIYLKKKKKKQLFSTKPKGGLSKKSVSEILMQGEIYAWSVIKSAYTESDGLD